LKISAHKNSLNNVRIISSQIPNLIFRPKHSTILQMHRLKNCIASAQNNTIFLDVTKTFDQVCHEDLTYTLKNISGTVLLTTQTYLNDRTFQVHQGDETSDYIVIESGVPQGSDLSLNLYSIFISDIPTNSNKILTIYTDNTAILYINNNNSITATLNLQEHISKIETWSK